MNLNFSSVKANPTAVRSGRSRPDTSHLTPRISQRGIALIITLIMLSVITFMTVTFLVLSQRERGSVTTTTDQLISKQTAESARERAQIELLSRMLALKNDQVYSMIVSTNFINPAGFNTAAIPEPDRFTNVNYSYANGNPLNVNDQRQNLANLLYNPRPPVFVTNRNLNIKEFRYYLDLNRNGRYDTNGIGLAIGQNGGFLHPDGSEDSNPVNGLTNFYRGDPEWIGVLERPELPYSSSNRFVARYAYIAIPSGQTLDVNYLHNQAKRIGVGVDGFSRNQGVGSYEINLAAFLADLNTNLWNPQANQYVYNTNSTTSSRGTAFEDALTLLRYRYSFNGSSVAGDYNNLFLGLPTADNGSIDEYANGDATGVLMTGANWINDFNDKANGFPGAENPMHFYTPQEFYDQTKFTGNFVDHLNLKLGSTTFTNSSYDRYTYYRLLDQLGTDSSPERDKININFRNMTNGVIVPGLETNQFVWNPSEFFTNAANRLMRSHTTEWLKSDFNNYTNTFGLTKAFGITNIPVFIASEYITNGVLVPTNYYGYTPSIHRLLQVTANILDASSSRTNSNYPQNPHTFRPIFRRDVSNNVFIVDYREVDTVSSRFLALLMTTNQVDLSLPTGSFSRSSLPLIGSPVLDNESEPMVSGIPLVIGARKGFPSFSKFAMQNAVTVSRTLQFHKEANQTQASRTNQSYSIGVSNVFGMQAFNSYGTAFPRPLVMYASADVTLYVTNEFGAIAAPPPGPPTLSNRFVVNLPPRLIPNWPAFKAQSATSFITPFVSNFVFLANNVRYVQTSAAGGGVMTGSGVPAWDTANTFHVPKLWLGIRTRARFVLVDTALPGRIVDYVNLDSEEAPVNIMQAVLGLSPVCGGGLPNNPDPGSFWCTNRVGNPTGRAGLDNYLLPTYGIQNQLDVASGVAQVSDTYWRSYNHTVNDRESSIEAFQSRLFDAPPVAIDFESPFNPTRTFFQYARWEANDPLVHYTVPDMTDLLGAAPTLDWDTITHSPIRDMVSANPLNKHYRPWGGNPNNPAETSVPTMVNTQVKDPMVIVPGVPASDNWDFPTNKLPNVGWLGRVHRGTPWQTIYMKSSDIPNDTWFRWTGNTKGLGGDAFRARPAMDRELFDVFTTALNENATRGQLPINQTNLAAWSAVLSGVPVITNNPADNTTGSTIIEPAALAPPVAQIVQGINLTRAITNQNGTLVFPNLQFPRLGDILAVPQLTEASPFLNTNSLQNSTAAGINDEVMERIPQQIMSLLTLNHSPKFVIYSYGQTLRPAENSIITASGPFFQMCTNYQVTAETATRTVLRIDGSFDPADKDNDDPVRRYPPRVVIEQYNVLPPD